MRFLKLLLVLLVLGAAAYWPLREQIRPALAALTNPDSGAAKGTGPNRAEPRGGAARPGPGARGGPTAVLTAEAVAGELPLRARTIGWVEPVDRAAIRARTSGVIIKLAVAEGQEVKAGDLLVKLDDRERLAAVARDQATLAKDQAMLERANADLARSRQLATKGAVSPQQLDLAEAEAKSAAATVEADKAALEANRIALGYTEIRAPFDGRIGAYSVTTGSLLQVGDPVVTLTRMAPLRVSFALPDRELARLRAAFGKSPLEVRATQSGAEEAPSTGKLTFIDNAVDNSSGTIAVKATMPNEDRRLWPGETVQVEIDLGAEPGKVLVPLSAVQQGQNGTVVYVVTADQTIDVRPVQIAGTDRGRIALNAGVEPGEQVVVEGQVRLSPGMKVVARKQEPAGPRPAAVSAAMPGSEAVR